MRVLKFTIITFFFGLGLSCNSPEKYPQTEISNGLIIAQLYLPDSLNGYYRGSRFDWSGIIPSLEYNGHSFFGKWFERHDPKIHDAIMGPVNDFSPLGYNESKPGESFVKIGVGVLLKPNESPYSFRTPYEILNYGKWEIKEGSNQVAFKQTLDDKNFSFEYRKTISLTKGEAEMLLEHSLKNTGNKTIETSVYNHNFLMIDEQPIGPGYITKFPFGISSEPQRNYGLAKIKGNRIVFQRVLKKNEHTYFPTIQGFGSTAKDNQIIVENQKSGAAVKIKGNRPLSRLTFWSSSKTICPEPYVDIKINPGETFEWQISYSFYTLKN